MKLLQFKASWCGPCKQQTKEFEENPIDVEVVAVDINEDKEDLSTKFSIRSIPTMILIGDHDEVICRWVGFTRSSIINNFIHELTNTSK